ncbi:hypothetical protein EXS65_00310 [Candidatus Peribacteria bacterium]|nr:hypothetical protein [Candidatus Peribacteria bacterium]
MRPHSWFKALVAVMLLGACTAAPTPPAQEEPITRSDSMPQSTLVESPNEKTPVTTDSLEVSERSGSILPVIITASGTIVMGETQSRHRLIVFSDYDCAYCRQFITNDLPWIKKQAEEGSMAIALVFVPMTADGENAARLAICAAEQEKFPEADEWLATHDIRAVDRKKFANIIGLNLQKLTRCVAKKNLLEGNRKTSEEYGVERVPFFTLGSDSWLGLFEKEELQERIEAALRK